MRHLKCYQLAVEFYHDRTRFFEIAMGSIRECQAILELEQDSFTASQKDLLDHLAAATYKLIKNSRR